MAACRRRRRGPSAARRPARGRPSPGAPLSRPPSVDAHAVRAAPAAGCKEAARAPDAGAGVVGGGRFRQDGRAGEAGVEEEWRGEEKGRGAARTRLAARRPAQCGASAAGIGASAAARRRSAAARLAARRAEGAQAQRPCDPPCPVAAAASDLGGGRRAAPAACATGANLAHPRQLWHTKHF